MTTPEQIEAWIQAGLPCDFIRVEGDGQHFEATIVSPEFRGQMRVGQHQRVYQALGDKMRAEIHALSMRTFTPEEWQAQHG
jgi:acid stress-induced BolA-like protein IbaG/YrbA